MGAAVAGRRARARGAVMLLAGLAAMACAPSKSASLDEPPRPAALEPAVGAGDDLYLEVFVNGASTDLIGHFSRAADGGLSAEPDELREVGILPAAQALQPDGLVALRDLPGISFVYDEIAQTLSFEAGDAERAARVIDARAASERAPVDPASGSGALLNYSLLASTGRGDLDEIWSLEGVSATLEPRLFGRFGVLDHAMIVAGDGHGLGGTTRLATTWTAADVGAMRTVRIGDVVTGGLFWTRPVRLGGLQVQSDFGLRPDLVTFPVPSLSGTAAVPSTVDVYLDNARQYSTNVPAGPFQISHLPVVEGGATARLVVRDSRGVEAVSESAFFASSRLLASGLFDYSAEMGLARRFFGLRSNDYDSRPMGSATLRYGLNDRLTLEGHAEGGAGLANGGLGGVFAIGSLGVAALSGAASTGTRGTGFQAAAEVRFDFGGLLLNARSQRTIGSYEDIASVTAEDFAIERTPGLLLSRRPPRAIDQMALSVPLVFDPSTLNFSFTRLETEFSRVEEIVGVSYSRPLPGNASLFASGFSSLDGRDAGLFAGLSISLAGRVTASVSGFAEGGSPGGVAEIARSPSSAEGDYGWRLRGGAGTTTSAAVSYNAAPARLDAGVETLDGDYRATARVEGALVASGGGAYPTRRIDDAFAVVDVGAPDVEVFSQNRLVGRTGRDGRILVPDLQSNQANDLSFDPAALPLDAVVEATRQSVTPAIRSGTVVSFGVAARGQAALVEFRRADGGFVPVGSIGRQGDGTAFVVGYDGQAYVAGLQASNDLVVEDGERGPCLARFAYVRNGEQPMISGVICRPMGSVP